MLPAWEIDLLLEQHAIALAGNDDDGGGYTPAPEYPADDPDAFVRLPQGLAALRGGGD